MGALISCGQIGQRPPGVGRKAVADHGCGRLRRSDEIGHGAVEVAALQCGRCDEHRLGVRQVGRHRLPFAEQVADSRDHPGRRLVTVACAGDERPNQPQRRLRTFHVASHPEQIAGGAARQRSGRTRNRDPVRRGQQRRRGHRLVRQHPGVAGASAPLQAHRAGVDIVGDPDESAGHDLPPGIGPRQEQPERERPRLEPAVSPHRRCRKGDSLLGDEIDAAVGDLCEDPRTFVGIERGAENLAPFAVARELAAEGRSNHHLVEPFDDLVARSRLAEPPGRDIGQREIAAEHGGRQCRQKARHRARFDHTGTERIGDDHRAVTHGLHQPRHAEARTRIELKRIGKVRIQPPHQHLRALEAGHRANEDAVVADRQVLALDQQKAEIAREVSVLEIGLVQRARRQHANTGIIAVG